MTVDAECSIADAPSALDSPVLALLRRPLGKPREWNLHVIAVEYSVEQGRGPSLQRADGLELLPIGFARESTTACRRLVSAVSLFVWTTRSRRITVPWPTR